MEKRLEEKRMLCPDRILDFVRNYGAVVGILLLLIIFNVLIIVCFGWQIYGECCEIILF